MPPSIHASANPSRAKLPGKRFLQTRRHAYEQAAGGAWTQAEQALAALALDKRFAAQDWVTLATARWQLGRSFSVTPQARELVTQGVYSKDTESDLCIQRAFAARYCRQCGWASRH